MSKPFVQPRPIGTAILSLAVTLCAALVLAASSSAAPGPIALEATPSPASFGKATVGEKAVLEVDIGNQGEVATVEKIVIEGPDQADFSSASNTCGGLGEGQHCTLTLDFTPSGTGTKQATAYIRFSGERPEENFELSGTGVVPHLAFSPPSHDFGIQAVNSGSMQQSFRLENDGEAAVQVGNVQLASYQDFWFDTNPNNGCSRLMQPGESCSFSVYFGPGNAGPYSNQLRAWAGGETFTAELSGEGVRPEVEVNPNPADFGAATVGASGATRTLTVTNSGKVPTGFFIAVVSGGDLGSFRLLDESCTGSELQPSQSCSARIHFAPLSAGARKATLSIFGDGEGGTRAALTGEGVDQAVTIAPAGFDFGSQAIEAKSAAHGFAVRNDGATPVSLGATTIVGANLDQFPLAGDECTGVSLGPGQECLVRLRFAPGTIGAKTATLRIGSDAGAFTASLAGLGVASEKAGSAESRSRKHRLRFLRGAVLSAAKARCRVSGGCGKARASKHAGSRDRAIR
jgi:hypothetical protein